MNKIIYVNQSCLFMAILLVVTLLSVNFRAVCAGAVTPEIPTVSDNENEFLAPQEEKEEYGDLYYPWNKRSIREDDSNQEILPAIVFFANSAIMDELTNSDNGEINDDNILNQKRGWKKMSVAWGKRRNAGQYMNRDFAPSASATGSWGKREPNWNNLKGMWGKRSDLNAASHKRSPTKNGQWNYLKGSWGKRSANFLENN